MIWSHELKLNGLVILLLLAKTAKAVRGCTVIAIQPDLRWKKAVCDSHTSLLTKLPTDLPGTIINLRITQQSIRRLDDGELRMLVYLEELYLDSCQLERIDLNAFEGLNRLRVLSLRNNSLQLHEGGLFPETFYHLPALKVLDLSENPLVRIPLNFFPNSLGKSLIELRLNHAKGEFPLKVEASTFAALRNVQILDFSFSRLETLSSKFRSVFQKMHKLRELQLGGNPWHCDCNLRWLREWYLSDALPSMRLSYEQESKFGILKTVAPTCESPYAFKGRLIFAPSGKSAIKPKEFVCKQWIDSDQKQITAISGSNVSLICQGYFEVNRSVQWFKDNVPLTTPFLNYHVSQSNSLDFTAFLNITHVRYEDGGIWECGIDDGDILQKAPINMTVKHISGVAAVTLMSETQRQNLVYAGVGVATVFALLAAIALTVFCYCGKRRLDKPANFSPYSVQSQQDNTHGVDVSNSRELIDNSCSDSPFPLKKVSVHDNNGKEVNGINAKSAEKNQTSSITPATTSTNLALHATLDDPLSKIISLTTATTTTAVMTQLASSTTCYQPTSIQPAMIVATEFPSPKNCTDLYQLPISGGYGSVSLPNHLIAQITGPSDSVTEPSACNSFLVSTPCPIHGINARFPNNLKELTVRTSGSDACPIHGSPASVISRKAVKEAASSFTQTPRYDAKLKSATSPRVMRNKTDKSSYHTQPYACVRRESFGSHRSDSSAQIRYRTLPSRMNANTMVFCPIHGHTMSPLPRRRISSTSFNQQNQFFLRNHETQNIKLNVPYCSSSASTSSYDSMAVPGENFEDYLSDLAESPALKCTESESSDYEENSRLHCSRPNLAMPLKRTGLFSRRNYVDISTSSSLEEVTGSMPGMVFSDGSSDQNSLSFTSDNRTHRHRTSMVTRAIFGEPLILTAMNRAPLPRNLSTNEGPKKCMNTRSGVTLNQCQSKYHKTMPSPKSILIKKSLRRKHRWKSQDFRD